LLVVQGWVEHVAARWWVRSGEEAAVAVKRVKVDCHDDD